MKMKQNPGMALDGGGVVRRFTEHSKNFTGNKASGGTTQSDMSNAVANAEAQINAMRAQSGETWFQAVDKVLAGSRDELEQYIRSKGETPVDTLNGVIVQAALLRASDIAAVSTAMDCSDSDALAEINSGETEAAISNTADIILAPDTQAALNAVIEHFQTRMEENTGSKNLRSSMELMKGQVATPSGADVGQGNYFDISSLIPGGTMSGTADSQVNAGVTTVANSDDDGEGGSTDWAGILTGIASAAGAISGAVKTVGSTVNGTASNIGAQSIQKYVSTNYLQIGIILLIVLVAIYLIARAASK